MDHNRDTVPVPASRKNISFQKLAEEFNYDCETFWNEVPKACVLYEDQRNIVTATKDLIAGLFMKESARLIMSAALDLSFYAKRFPTDARFLYEKVARFVAHVEEYRELDEVLVQFRFRGWCDKWAEKSEEKTGMEKEFFDFLSKSENETTICFIGPWLATILLKLDRKSSSQITSKILKFFFAELPSFSKKEFAEEWVRLLEKFPKGKQYEPKKEALHRAMIETSFIDDRRAWDLMYFTTLQSMGFSDMLLVKMIDSFQKDRPMLKLYQIEEATRTSKTAYSWNTYSNFLTFFRGGLSRDEQTYAKYAREFNSDAFSNLSYANNPILCNYLAIIAEYCKKIEGFATSNVPTYAKLTSNRGKVEPMTHEDYKFCAIAAKKLLAMESNARNGIVAAQNNRIKPSENKTLPDEAKTSQVRKTPLEKIPEQANEADETPQARKTILEKIRDGAKATLRLSKTRLDLEKSPELAKEADETPQARKTILEKIRDEAKAKATPQIQRKARLEKISDEAKATPQVRRKAHFEKIRDEGEAKATPQVQRKTYLEKIRDEAKATPQFQRKARLEKIRDEAKATPQVQRKTYLEKIRDEAKGTPQFLKKRLEKIRDEVKATPQQVPKTRLEKIRELASGPVKKCQKDELVEE